MFLVILLVESYIKHGDKTIYTISFNYLLTNILSIVPKSDLNLTNTISGF
jgi:hypothetical protein